MLELMLYSLYNVVLLQHSTPFHKIQLFWHSLSPLFWGQVKLFFSPEFTLSAFPFIES